MEEHVFQQDLVIVVIAKMISMEIDVNRVIYYYLEKRRSHINLNIIFYFKLLIHV